MNIISLAIADDSLQFRKSLSRVLKTQRDFNIAIQAENGSQLLLDLEKQTVDIVLLDLQMPLLNGIQTAEQIIKYYPEIKVIAYSQYDIEDNIVQINKLGVKSFIGKSDDPEEVFTAIRVVHRGGVYMTERAARIVHKHLESPATDNNQVTLCDSDINFLKMILDGKTSREIGNQLNRSHRTVEDMREKLYVKYNVRNKEQLIVLLSKCGL